MHFSYFSEVSDRRSLTLPKNVNISTIKYIKHEIKSVPLLYFVYKASSTHNYKKTTLVTILEIIIKSISLGII